MVRKSRISRLRDIASQIGPNDKVLDLGADKCQLKEFLQTTHYVPVDVRKTSPEMLTVNFGFEKLPFEDNSFDIVVLSLLLGHIDNPTLILQEARRVLREQGKAIFVFPNIENLNKIFHSLFFQQKLLQRPNGSHIYQFGTEEIVNLLSRQGFSIVSLRKRCNELFNHKVPLPDCLPLFANYVFVVATLNPGKALYHPYQG